MRLAIPAAPMRVFALVAALALLAFGSAANAQNTLTISRVYRNSPRNSETIGGVQPTDPIGLRDCACETWEFTIDYTLTSTTSTVMSWWVGTSESACTTSAGRSNLNPATQTCYQLTDSSVQPAAFMPGGQGTVRVTVPSRFLVNPVDGSCTPLSTRSTSDTLYFTVIVTPPGDPPAAIATKAVTYNVTTPQAPLDVAADAEEAAAKVTWTTVASDTTTTDGGTTTTTDDASTGTGTSLSPSVVGFYVLCLPRPAGWDAGSAGEACDGSVYSVDVASGTDAYDVADAPDVTDVVDASDAGVAEAGGADVTDVTDAAATADVVDDNPGNVACTMGLPANFNPNDPNQFSQYVCSSLLGRSATSYEVTGLVNGSTYRFAVVSQDNAGNRSVASLSSNCTTPELVTDFWEHYRERGGQAQPGFCSARPGPAGRADLFAWALACAAALAVARRNRRVKRAARSGGGDA